MYKSKLQEVCQQKGWVLPKYETTRLGLDHQPLFKATVTVNCYSFQSQSPSRSSKEAQNDAARLAFLHFSPSSPADPPPASSPARNVPPLTTPHPSLEAVSVQQPYQPRAAAKVEPFQVAADFAGSSTLRNEQKLSTYNVAAGAAFPVQRPHQPVVTAKTDDHFQEAHHLCKNQLQTYAQKRNLPLPVYSSECQGPPHARRFKGRVTVDGKTFESWELFTTLNKAELAAAKLALISLLPDGTEQDDLSYKNILQELAQRKGYPLPVYTTNVSGEAHFPNFASTVEIGGEVFKGQEARTKKQAETSAAKVAYMALNPCNSSKGLKSLYLATSEQDTPQLSSSSFSAQDAPQLSSSSLRGDLTAYLLENVQPKLPPLSEGVEHRGLESSSAVGRVTSSSGAMPTLADLAVNSAIEHLIGISSLCQNRIIVHPRKEAVTYPPGSCVLPISDDDWVAVKVTPSSNP